MMLKNNKSEDNFSLVEKTNNQNKIPLSNFLNKYKWIIASILAGLALIALTAYIVNRNKNTGNKTKTNITNTGNQTNTAKNNNDNSNTINNSTNSVIIKQGNNLSDTDLTKDNSKTNSHEISNQAEESMIKITNHNNEKLLGLKNNFFPHEDNSDVTSEFNKKEEQIRIDIIEKEIENTIFKLLANLSIFDDARIRGTFDKQDIHFNFENNDSNSAMIHNYFYELVSLTEEYNKLNISIENKNTFLKKIQTLGLQKVIFNNIKEYEEIYETIKIDLQIENNKLNFNVKKIEGKPDISLSKYLSSINEQQKNNIEPISNKINTKFSFFKDDANQKKYSEITDNITKCLKDIFDLSSKLSLDFQNIIKNIIENGENFKNDKETYKELIDNFLKLNKLFEEFNKSDVSTYLTDYELYELSRTILYQKQLTSLKSKKFLLDTKLKNFLDKYENNIYENEFLVLEELFSLREDNKTFTYQSNDQNTNLSTIDQDQSTNSIIWEWINEKYDDRFRTGTLKSTINGEEKTYNIKPETNLYGANLTDANLSGANLKGANLSGADFYEADLTRAILTGANLYRAILFEADLTRANLTKADLSGAYLRGANLSQANLTDANLSGANLTDANLSGAYLTGHNLYEADLKGAKYDSETIFPNGFDPIKAGMIRTGPIINIYGDVHTIRKNYENLSWANLTKADLSGADLRRANLRRANLNGAILTGAYLTGADLTGADLTGAKYSDETKFPEGFNPLERGMIKIEKIQEEDNIKNDVNQEDNSKNQTPNTCIKINDEVKEEEKVQHLGK